jgi:paraquat-inducible protein B
VKALGTKVGGAADAVIAFINSPDARQAFANLNGTLTELRAALAKLDGNITPVSDELKQTLATAQAALKSLDATAVTTQKFVSSQGNVGDELTQSLRQLADAAAALERLADTIDRNPSSLIVGKKKPGTP